MPKHRHSTIDLVGYDAESMLSLQPCSHPESRLVSASASFDPFYSLARTQCTSSQLNRDCQTSRRPRNTAWASPSAYFNLFTTYHPLGFDYYLHLSLPLLHSNQPHSSSNSITTQPRRPQQTNKQINQSTFTLTTKHRNHAVHQLRSHCSPPRPGRRPGWCRICRPRDRSRSWCRKFSSSPLANS